MKLQRKSISKFGVASVVCSTLVAVLVTGCGKGLPTPAELNDSNIKRLHSAYMIYMDGNGNKGPASEDELKDYLSNNQTAKVLMERMDIPGDISQIFVSERDGEPFKVRWGLSGVADHAIVFESTGVEGKRMVAFSNPRELDSSEYEGFWSGETEPDAPPGAGNVNSPTFVEPDRSGG